MAPPTHRQNKALALRREGATIEVISKLLRISMPAARQLLRRAYRLERQSRWTAGLSPRISSTLLAGGIGNRKALATALANGSLARMPGIGRRHHEAIVAWMKTQ